MEAFRELIKIVSTIEYILDYEKDPVEAISDIKAVLEAWGKKNDL